MQYRCTSQGIVVAALCRAAGSAAGTESSFALPPPSGLPWNSAVVRIEIFCPPQPRLGTGIMDGAPLGGNRWLLEGNREHSILSV